MLVKEIVLCFLFFSTVYGVPVSFPENGNEDLSKASDVGELEEGRTFLVHGIKKKVKKKIKRRLLQCLLSAATGRNALPSSRDDPQGRTLFLNFYDVDIHTNGEDDHYNDQQNSGGGLCGGSSSGLGFGEGINNLGSFVGQNPLQGTTDNNGDDVKPVYENPERLLNRYFFRSLYRSLRPLYYFF